MWLIAVADKHTLEMRKKNKVKRMLVFGMSPSLVPGGSGGGCGGSKANKKKKEIHLRYAGHTSLLL